MLYTADPAWSATAGDLHLDLLLDVFFQFRFWQRWAIERFDLDDFWSE